MKWLNPRNRWAQRYGSLLVLIPLLLLLSSPWWGWWLLRRPAGRAVILDKTVLPGNLREHESLEWVLRHAKVGVHDYIGPHYSGTTLETEHSTLQSQDLEGADYLFLADTYGIYRENGQETRDLGKIVGGLDEAEISRIEQYMQAGGRLYGEFNCLAFPTQGSARARLEKLLGVRFSGWTGRYFPDLADPQEVPLWMRRSLKSLTDQDWVYTGPGYVLLHEDGRVVVLVEGQDIPPQALLLESPDGSSTPFAYWFDIVESQSPSGTWAEFHWVTYPSARLKFHQQGIPFTFPAVVCGQRSLYCCGDFSDNPCARGPYWLEGWPRYNGWRWQSSGEPGARFFWTFYLPLLEKWLSSSQR